MSVPKPTRRRLHYGETDGDGGIIRVVGLMPLTTTDRSREVAIEFDSGDFNGPHVMARITLGISAARDLHDMLALWLRDQGQE